MREVGLVIYAGYQPTGFAVTSPFEIARERSGRRVLEIWPHWQLSGNCGASR